jgi:hypothetical protein
MNRNLGGLEGIELKTILTRTLLKFCEDHNYPPLGLTDVRQCLEFLERRDLESAVKAFKKVPLGGRMGYFDEWCPQPAFKHETSEYVQVVFAAITAQWASTMKGQP